MPEAKYKNRRKRKHKIVTRGKSYSIKDSWLYNIQSKTSLCAKLETNLSALNLLTDNANNYQIFYLDKTDGKKREIQAPKFELDKLHSRIASLLARINVPDHLHSGVKGRSNITNAKLHLGDTPTLTLDIKNFYPSVTQKSVYHFFSSKLNCAPDVAGLLASLCTYKDHVPTGSRLSMILAYWANEPMFERLTTLCLRKNITMSTYVDDLTFSGENVDRVFQKNVVDIITKSGMTVHPHKTKMYRKDQPKVITGVVVTGNRISVCNKHHKSIYDAFNSIDKAKNEAELEHLRNVLIGKLNAAGQIDKAFSQRAKNIRREFIKKPFRNSATTIESQV